MLTAYMSGDDEALRAVIDPEGEIHGDAGIVNSGTYRGFDGFRQWVGQIDSVFGWMYEFRDGRTLRFHVYATLEDAIETADRLAADG